MTRTFILAGTLILTAVFVRSASSTELDAWGKDKHPPKLKATPIDFGNLLITRDAGKVTMDKSGAITFSGGVLQAYGFPQVGTLTIDAEQGTIATITPAPSVSLGEGVTFLPVSDKTTVAMSGFPEVVRIYGSIDFTGNTKTKNLKGILDISVDYN